MQSKHNEYNNTKEKYKTTPAIRQFRLKKILVWNYCSF